MSIEASVAELVRCSGTQFDPKIVTAMIGAVEGGRVSLVPRVPSYAAAVA